MATVTFIQYYDKQQSVYCDGVEIGVVIRSVRQDYWMAAPITSDQVVTNEEGIVRFSSREAAAERLLMINQFKNSI